ncbi:sensor histidine kinase [Niabella beijingensis]|uniref:sensor histidine kinase n=1 Tax=Niabella beijingensis TaxID=2872700 RepID=UPI001CBC9FF3|nr:HAMP domain-containing sensor histidine kinase [Niabella beijingensis]MBZ4189307.1 HAMP domain-containing histidine kinase [Niabella beijingensis]
MQNNLFKKLGQHLSGLYGFLAGDAGGTTLEVRIFNTICLLGIIICAYNIPFNFYVGLDFTAWVFSGLTLLLFLLYYLSRFRQQYRYSITLISVLFIGLFVWNYFYSDGIRGASLLSYTLLFFLLMIIAPKKQYLLWFLLVTGATWGNMLYELYHPASVKQTYTDLKAIIIDHGSTVTINLVVLFAGLYYLKEAYYRERRKTAASTKVLKEMDQQKTKLFSVLSHDLRSPLHSISAYLEMVQSDTLSKEERLETERLLSTAVHHTQELLNNMLSWSKDQLRKTAPELHRQTIASVIQPTLVLFEPEAQRKKIRFTRNIDPSVTALINASMLQIIVRNLMGNAIKFTHPGGHIIITITGDEAHALIMIKDTGRGIKKELRQQLFSLNTGSTYGTLNEKGVGLGLYLCKEYTLAQNGRIWFETEEEKGTTFFVQLPV